MEWIDFEESNKELPNEVVVKMIEGFSTATVVMTYSMSKRITDELIGVLENTGTNVFFDDKSNTVRHSDHLPLTYEYKLA